MEIDKIADAAAEVIHDGPDHADNDTGEDDAPYAFPAAVETANAQHGTDMCATVGRSPEADIDSLAIDQEPTPMEEVEHHTPVPTVTPKTSTRRSKPHRVAGRRYVACRQEWQIICPRPRKGSPQRLTGWRIWKRRKFMFHVRTTQLLRRWHHQQTWDLG
ncbi:hypothetical protein PRIC1_012077 [Phytophthora ramorum]